MVAGVLVRLFFFTLILSSAVSSNAATLRWAENPFYENIAFYTVYIDSPIGAMAHEVRDAFSFSLDDLLPNIPYVISVSATSSEGEESGHSAPVPYNVGFPLPTITEHPVGAILASRVPLILLVSATGPPGLKYEWYKHNRPVPDQFSPILSIPDPTPDDSGTYTAVVSTPGGHIESHPAEVIVQDPPLIIAQPASASLGVGARFELSVNASGTSLRYQWYKGVQPISDATNYFLSFPHLTLSDKGSYRVAVWNLIDRIASEAAILDVSHLPVTLTAGPNSTSLIEGETIRLSVDVSGSTPITFQWMKDGLPLIGWLPLIDATNAILVIASATTKDSGLYYVNVANPISFATISIADVTVIPQPQFSECILTVSTSDAGILRITATATPSATYELQGTDSLKDPNWVRIQDIIANPEGRFEIAIDLRLQTEFIRALQK